MEQTLNLETTLNPNVVPRGKGGVAGHAFRMITMFLTCGFAFPNTMVEGMDLTAMQQKTQGLLYDKDKKGAGSKSRF
jgi:hypothetical protein